MTAAVPEFRAIFRDAPTALAVCTRGEVIVEANSAFAQLLGRTVGDLADTELPACVHPGDRQILHGVCANTDIAAAGAERRVRIVHPDGSEHPVTVTASITTEAGVAVGCILRLDDASTGPVREAAPTSSPNHPATGLPDRRTFLDRCRRTTGEGNLIGTQTAVTVVAVQDFTTIETRFGRLVAEAVAIEMARRVTGTFHRVASGDTGTTACVAAGTFAVVSENTTLAKAVLVAERLRRETARPIHLTRRPLQCATSVVVSTITDNDDPATLLAAMIRDTLDHPSTSLQ
ncbi:sensor domain-containing diguanylate cyclase [Antrihabitans cavernicola]|uniref:PAS domain S-box protein n=1 Tax=Antrihabitans cavernicola TaxID=2495913 RepID=A0A5A7S445_9NOCA|nr:PAS domain S-box protein [Spelaeibacter cavernicola]KAA0016551.1 PAS domain S-box protein [Spelaeibacter cavernicola]